MPVRWCDVVNCGCRVAYLPTLYIFMYLRIYVRHRLDTDGVGLKFPPHRLASGVGGLRFSHEISLDPLHGRSEAKCKAGGVTPPDLKFQRVNLTRKERTVSRQGDTNRSLSAQILLIVGSVCSRSHAF